MDNSSPFFVPIIEPVRTCGRPVRLDFRRWPSRIYSPAVATYPTASLGVEGVEALPADLEINSVSIPPDFRYVASDSVGETWPADGYGDCLTRVGESGNIVQSSLKDSPGYQFKSESPRFTGGSTIGNLGNNDAVIEVVIRMPLVFSDFPQVLAKRGTGVNGWEIATTALGKLLFLPLDQVPVYVLAYSGSLSPGCVVHAIIFVDRSGFCQWYINGIASGPAYDVSGIGAVNPAEVLSIGRWIADVSQQFTGQLMLAQMWTRAAWLDTHLQPTIAASRYAALIGRGDRYSRRIYSFAAGSKLGTVAPYFSCMDLTVGSDCTVAVPGTGGSWHWGSDMPRLIDGGLAIMPAEDHLLINSGLPSDYCQTLDGLVVAELAAVGPSGCTDAGSITEDEVHSYHSFTSRTVTVTENTTYSSSIWFKPYTVGDPRRVRVVSGESIVDVDLATGAITQSIKGPSSVTVTDSGWVQVSLSVYTVSTSLDIQVFLIAYADEGES